MKITALLLSLFIFSLLSYSVQAQLLDKTDEDTLNLLYNHKEYHAYFKKINRLSEGAYKLKDSKTLFYLGTLLKQEFGEMTDDEHMLIRREAMNTGFNIQKITGNINESLAVYLIAHQHVNDKKNLDSLAWYIENVISNLYTRKGDYEKAQYYSSLLESSLRYYKMTEQLSRCCTNLGTILESQFKIDQAILAFERGYQIADSIHYNSGIFGNVLSLANVYNQYPDLGSPELYLLKAEEVLPMLTHDNGYLEKKAGLEMEIADYKNAHGKCLESIPHYKEAILTLTQYYPNTKRREFAKYYTSFAKAYICSDSLIAAKRTINLGIACLIPEFKEDDEMPLINQLFPENSFVNLLELKSQIYEQDYTASSEKKDLQKALSCIELALDVNDMIRETVVADPSKLVSIRSNKGLIGKAIAILYKLTCMDNSNNYYARARTLFNRSKSVLYNDKTRRNNLTGLLSSSDRQRWIALQDSLVNGYESKFETGADINYINGKILAFQEQIDKLFESYNSELLITQEPDQYVEYLITQDNIYSLSSFNGQQKFLKLGLLSDFQGLGDRLNEFISQKAMSLDDGLLKDIYTFLIKPVTVHLPDHFVIIPDGSIGYVPFEMLQDEEGKYLFEKSTISYSFEYQMYQEGSVHDDRSLEVYCLAPKYKLKELKGTEVSRGSIYDLPFAKMEVDSIKRLYGSSAMTSQSGDKKDLDQKLNEAHIFHYAGHAIIRNEKAYLALNDSGEEKQQLTASEIGLKHHALDLVVLSACETGLGKMEQGEGIRSLGRSFMESGAQATVISLWNVNDRSTAMIMAAFYKYLKNGKRKDDALRQAKLDYITQAQLRFKHPYYWAAFIPAGDMSVLQIK
ncbi:MAG: CHAT domain-containing protein [Saprospiraceae bacterium]|uniref:CHAT domain-containing protein n=1 Tax=Candidatus Opimibacter skivensis TaxID=2982028 RepID=A0A9D7SV26_9BACT|nr:CHAT domain-containing protein [Candidatus Opimibacter skivensis]